MEIGEECQKNRPFRAYSDAGIRCLGANLLPVAGHIRPVRDGLDREAKRGWLCTRPSVQRSIDIIRQKSGDRQEICKLNDPGKPALRRLGILPQQLRTSPLIAPDHPGEAIDPLQAYLAALPDAADAEPVTALLNAARRQVARWH